MASAVFFLDQKGKPLLSRNYRGDIPMSAVEKFPLLLLENEEENVVAAPCINSEGINYIYITHNNLYLLALSKRNNNAMEMMLFLHKLVDVLTEYLKRLNEETIKDNFGIIYELLDEMMDYGHPQTTETKILKQYITQHNRIIAMVLNTPQARPPVAVTNAVSWRADGITYRKNEAFLDVVESVNMLCGANGKVIRSEILGSVQMKCLLSGMPELRLGLNDRVIFDNHSNTTGKSVASTDKAIEMEDVKFHQCVRLSRFDVDRTISFIPPDGEFELMSYRLNTPVKPLIWVDCKITKHSASRIEILARARGQFKKRSVANNVEIKIPVPDDADTPKFKAVAGSVKWKPEQAAVVWKLKHFGGGREFAMRAELGLPAIEAADGLHDKRPIQVSFSIPYFTTSGIQVRYLKIIEPKLQYQSYPWVRYITKSGDDYAIRVQ